MAEDKEETEDQSTPLKPALQDASGDQGEETQQAQEAKENKNDGVLIAEQLLGTAANVSNTKKRIKEGEQEKEPQ